MTDVFARRIVGWRVGRSLGVELALDALEVAIAARGSRLPGHVHHSDRGTRYVALRYTKRLAAAEAAPSVGRRGDSYDNAPAASINALYKAELADRRRWATVEELERATAGWVGWWNTARLHEAIGHVPPAEFEATYHRAALPTAAA